MATAAGVVEQVMECNECDELVDRMNTMSKYDELV